MPMPDWPDLEELWKEYFRDWLDQGNADPDVDPDDDEATEWDEMGDWDLDGEEGDDDDEC